MYIKFIEHENNYSMENILYDEGKESKGLCFDFKEVLNLFHFYLYLYHYFYLYSYYFSKNSLSN